MGLDMVTLVEGTCKINGVILIAMDGEYLLFLSEWPENPSTVTI